MYITLSDLSTYDSIAYLVALTDAGVAQLEEVNDMQNVDGDNFEAIIPLSALISAYNQVHNTSYPISY